MQPTLLPIMAVGGVVYRIHQDSTEILLIKKRGGYWTLPKGHVDLNESQKLAVAREVLEETGINGSVEDVVKQLAYTIKKRGTPCHKVVTYFLVHGTSGEPQPDARERIKRVRWVPIERALTMIGRSRVRDVVEHALRMLNGQERVVGR